jgi:hypothetical protein
MNQIVEKAKAKGNYQRLIFNRKKNTKIYWVIGAIVVIGIGAYLIYRHKKNAAKLLSNGGGIDVNPVPPVTPTPAPIQTPPVVPTVPVAIPTPNGV